MGEGLPAGRVGVALGKKGVAGEGEAVKVAEGDKQVGVAEGDKGIELDGLLVIAGTCAATVFVAGEANVACGGAEIGVSERTAVGWTALQLAPLRLTTMTQTAQSIQ
ncbi:MAG: hypothetical protein GX620_08310 [Chloroflexi bacterium]|nr:hypothetical protein [Chloroflexota bacterium]